MPDILVRLGIFILVSLLLLLIVWTGKRFVERQRRQVLAAVPPDTLLSLNNTETQSSSSPVRILAFTSSDCHQCHTLQQPALNRVLEERGQAVSVVEVDAPSSPQLVQTYHVLTVPTTVVLDPTGRAHAVNYGFANTQRLLEQVDEVLAQAV